SGWAGRGRSGTTFSSACCFSVATERLRSTGGRSLPVRVPKTERSRNRTNTATTMAMRVGRSRKSSIKLAPCGANGKKRRAALVRRHHAPIYRQSFSPKPVHDRANCVFAAPRAPQARISSLARLILWGFAALPLVEIALFIVVGRAIGLLPTLLLVI